MQRVRPSDSWPKVAPRNVSLYIDKLQWPWSYRVMQWRYCRGLLSLLAHACLGGWVGGFAGDVAHVVHAVYCVSFPLPSSWQQPVDFNYLSDRYSLFAEDFLKSAADDDKPFFLYVPFSHIHTPQYAMPRNQGRSNVTGKAGYFYDSLLEVKIEERKTVYPMSTTIFFQGIPTLCCAW